MEQKLLDNLIDGEQVLWSGKPEFKIFGETHKNFFAAKLPNYDHPVIGKL